MWSPTAKKCCKLVWQGLTHTDSYLAESFRKFKTFFFFAIYHILLDWLEFKGMRPIFLRQLWQFDLFVIDAGPGPRIDYGAIIWIVGVRKLETTFTRYMPGYVDIVSDLFSKCLRSQLCLTECHLAIMHRLPSLPSHPFLMEQPDRELIKTSLSYPLPDSVLGYCSNFYSPKIWLFFTN